MQIRNNTTAMVAGLSVAVDKDGLDLCVVVVKGTFLVATSGESVLAQQQEPLIYADAHYGDPAKTSLKYECDFAPFKPRADVLLNGHAVSQTGRPVPEVTVGIETGSIKKHIRVVGDRRWDRGLYGLRPSTPVPFVQMPLVYERAFGGSDYSHKNSKYWGAELRNPIGIGFHKNGDSAAIAGTPLPNLEHPQELISKWSDAPRPASFGVVGRAWQPRIKFAGTYDAQWKEERFPFSPADFDPRYFLSAPPDQQTSYFRGGEVVRCTNMTEDGCFYFTVPVKEVPLAFRFRDKMLQIEPALDTLIVEPDQRRFLAVWRAAVPIGRKLNALQEVLVGPQPDSRQTRDKPHFASLAELVAWRRTLVAQGRWYPE